MIGPPPNRPPPLTPTVFYRQDNRAPNKLQQDGGFSARATLSAADARALIKRLCVNGSAAWAPAQQLVRAQLIREVNGSAPGSGHLNSMMQTIKKETANDTVQNSLGITDTGGRSTRYVYRITIAQRFAVLQPNGGLLAVVAQNLDGPGILQHLSQVRPHVLSNNVSVDAATFLAIVRGPAHAPEVACLTSIPLSVIGGCRDTHVQGNVQVPIPWHFTGML